MLPQPPAPIAPIGLDTPPCIVDQGRLSVETSMIDWTRQNDPDAVTDTIVLGDLALRYGVDERTELRLAWTAYGHVRRRDRQSGVVTKGSSTSDLTLCAKFNLIGASGEGSALALVPSLTLPTGDSAIGAGDWGASLQAAVALPLSGSVALILTPEMDAAVNGSGSGRHFAYGAAGGLALTPAKGVSLAIEAQVIRDDDPAEPSTHAIAGAALGVMVGLDMQLDIGGEFALNAASPDRHVYVGIARRF